MAATVSGALLVAGTTSDAGKSVLTAGICRWLRRQGVRVAPFKAQNMSNNSAVVLDEAGGGEIGRAQAMQAAACGIAPSVRFNPVLLKPGSDRRSQVVLLGRAVGHVDAVNYRSVREQLRGAVLDTLTALRAEYDVVVCEGAGSPAEINLRDGDIVNMGLARAADLPTIVVGDIDRGGVFAALYGTLALLDEADQALLAGFVVNKFRGDRGLLQPGLDALEKLTGRPTYGVLPWHPDLWLDGEDSLAYGRLLGRPAAPYGSQWLRVAVVRLPRISNATDAEAFAAEPRLRGEHPLREVGEGVHPGLTVGRPGGAPCSMRRHSAAVSRCSSTRSPSTSRVRSRSSPYRVSGATRNPVRPASRAASVRNARRNPSHSNAPCQWVPKTLPCRAPSSPVRGWRSPARRLTTPWWIS